MILIASFMCNTYSNIEDINTQVAFDLGNNELNPKPTIEGYGHFVVQTSLLKKC